MGTENATATSMFIKNDHNNNITTTRYLGPLGDVVVSQLPDSHISALLRGNDALSKTPPHKAGRDRESNHSPKGLQTTVPTELLAAPKEVEE